ncbi:hypothetical protein AB0399_00295 [Streptomyces sp. NPDC088194]|uniref:hypothetical protein n=1 Tax=Streptomyces sp. NPDC088194 TaxID=3154931 RepID=UPI00344C5FE1
MNPRTRPAATALAGALLALLALAACGGGGTGSGPAADGPDPADGGYRRRSPRGAGLQLAVAAV